MTDLQANENKELPTATRSCKRSMQHIHPEGTHTAHTLIMDFHLQELWENNPCFRVIHFVVICYSSSRIGIESLKIHMYIRVCSVTQSCPILCSLMNCSHQAPLSMGFPRQEILEWVAISLSRGSSSSRDETCISCIFWFGRQILYH